MQENAMGPFERRRSKITRRQLSEALTAWFWEGWISTFVEQVHKWALLSFFQGSRSVQIISASTLPSMLLTSTMWLSGEVWIRAAHSSQVDFCLIIPFTPESDQSQISPPAPPEILHHTVRRTWLFIAYSLMHFLFKRLGEWTFWAQEWKGYLNIILQPSSPPAPHPLPPLVSCPSPSLPPLVSAHIFIFSKSPSITSFYVTVVCPFLFFSSKHQAFIQQLVKISFLPLVLTLRCFLLLQYLSSCPFITLIMTSCGLAQLSCVVRDLLSWSFWSQLSLISGMIIILVLCVFLWQVTLCARCSLSGLVQFLHLQQQHAVFTLFQPLSLLSPFILILPLHSPFFPIFYIFCNFRFGPPLFSSHSYPSLFPTFHNIHAFQSSIHFFVHLCHMFHSSSVPSCIHLPTGKNTKIRILAWSLCTSLFSLPEAKSTVKHTMKTLSHT